MVITESNFQMLKEIDSMVFENQGYCTEIEVSKVKKALHLDEMDEIQLQNMRDISVAHYTIRLLRSEKHNPEIMDKMSAITGIIDNTKFEKGYEV